MPSMGGSATLISAPRYGDLINVDTTGQADHQVFAWDATAGKYKPLVGVVGDGAGGLSVAETLTAGDATGLTEQFHTLNGMVFLEGGQAVLDDQDGPLFARLTGAMAGNLSPTVGDLRMVVQRNGHLQGGFLLRLFMAADPAGPGLVQPGEYVLWTESEDLGVGVRANAAGGLAAFGHAVPTAQPAITGALSTVADAPAKAVLTSIIAALVGCGLASNSTT